MPKARTSAKPVEAPEEAPAVEETVEEAPEEADSKSGVATVSWQGRTREYSKELHGKDYKALAKEFAGKVNGTVA